jgi:hypothetical protein
MFGILSTEILRFAQNDNVSFAVLISLACHEQAIADRL